MYFAQTTCIVFGKLKVVHVAVENWATPMASNRYACDIHIARNLIVRRLAEPTAAQKNDAASYRLHHFFGSTQYRKLRSLLNYSF